MYFLGLREVKQVILLHYCEDMTVKKIAEVLKQKENTISVRLKRAKEMLKLDLEEATL